MLTNTESTNPDTADSIIELNGLSLRFFKKEILRDLTCTLTGQAIGLLGPNGAGKTTLIHTLLGFHKPTAGSGKILGKTLNGAGKSIRSHVGYMPETNAFIPGMSAIRLVRYLAELNGLPPADAMERAHEALFYVGLGEARYRKIETFSQGMMQRMKLAQAIVHSPSIVFLDEPTNGLDPAGRIRMIELLKDIRAKKAIHLIISSHLLKDVEETCDEVLILKEGRVAAYCNIEEERKSNRRFLELEIAGDRDAFLHVLENRNCQYTRGIDAAVKLIIPETMEIRDIFRIAADQNAQIRKLNLRKDSLEDIFLRAMEGYNGSL